MACMYSHVFVIELFTGLVKTNIKRLDIMKDVVVDLFQTVVEKTTYLTLELTTIIECVYDIMYTCIQYNQIGFIHKLLSILTSISHLPTEIFQEIAPLVASGVSVLIAEYGSSLSIIGCWNLIVELLNCCIIEDHAIRYCLN